LGVRNISSKGILELVDLTRIPIEKYDESPEIKLQEGDILLAKTGATIGKSCVVKELREPMTVNAAVNIFRLFDGINPIYFNQIITAPQTQYQFWANTSENARGNLFQRDIAKVLIPFTKDIDEQIKIGHFLEKKTAEIDQIIANKQKLIALYEEEKQAIINQAVTKGLDPTVKLKESGVEWLGEIPEHWEQKNLKYLARVQTGGTPKIQNAKMDYFADGTINWYTPSDFYNDGVLEDSNRKINEFAVEENEVEIFPENSVYLVSIGATLGKVGLSKTRASANQQINVIIFDKSLLNPFYGYYFLVSHKEMIKLEADYTTLPILNQTKTKSLTIAYPNLKEQDEIVQYIDKECVRINTILEKFNKQIDLLKEYRTTLISEVVTGKIKVPNTIEV
jgi:type I restriction enzyme S subunit